MARGTVRTIAALVAAITLVLTTAAGAAPSGAQAPPGDPTVPAGGRPGKPTDMTPRLAAVADPVVATSSAAAQARAAGVPADGPASLLRDDEGRLVVDVTLADSSPAALASLRTVGADLVATDKGSVLATVTVDAGSLRALADLPAVAYVAEVPAPQTSAEGGTPGDDGPLTDATCPTGILSEGDGQLRADDARATFGVDGTGVHVGVLSDSYDNLAGAAGDVAAAELPGPANPCGRLTPVGIQADLASGGIDEGRAMAQIVHDLAPGATQTFATAFLGDLDFAAQITALGVAGADVITDDVFYFHEPMFQDGPIAVAINENRTVRDIPHFTSGGNSNVVVGGRSVGSYEAPAFRPTTCPVGVPAYNNACHDFDPTGGADGGNGLTVANNGTVRIGLGWSEPMYGVTTDLDLYLVDTATNTVVAASEADNSASMRANEALAYTNTSGGTRTYAVVAGRYSGSPNPAGTPRLKTVLFRASGLTAVEWNQSTGGDVSGPTLTGHSAAALAMGTAAVPFSNSATPESFSSRGPAAICWAPVSGATPQPALSPCEVVQPDLAATDGGKNSFFGSFDGQFHRFYGTSAAAPHAAAVAALARELAPCATAQQVEDAMTSTAVPVGAFGVDSVGAGLVDAEAALAQLEDACAPSISGTVTAEATGTPVAGVLVGAFAPGDTWLPSVMTTTAADGTYVLADVVDGPHRVIFSPPGGSGLVLEWWDDATASTATPVTVAGAPVSGIDAALATAATISGTVVTDGTGTPVAGAPVSAVAPTDTWWPTATTTTAADGTYVLTGLPAGSYKVVFGQPAGTPYRSEWHQDVASRDAATPVVVAAGAVVDVDASLFLPTRVTGTVTGPGGTAAAGITVAVWAPSGTFVPARATTTAADGTYRIDGLPPGDYRIRFDAPVGSGLADEWYDDAATRSTGTIVSLVPGTTTADAQLAAAP